MSVEELLSPRYEIIADYPLSRFIIGTILISEKDRFGNWYVPSNAGDSLHFDIDEYPHLFKPLRWWENRDIKDMPKYIRHKNGTCFLVKQWTNSPHFGGIWYLKENKSIWSNAVEPITKEQYEYVKQHD